MTPLAERLLLLTPTGVTGLRGLDLPGGRFHRPGTSLFRFVPELLMEGRARRIQDASVQALLVPTARGGQVAQALWVSRSIPVLM